MYTTLGFAIGILDYVVFVGFVLFVIVVALWKSRTVKGKEKDAQDFFLAGRGLKWYLIGFSLIAANISTEQFVGMSGNAASHVGMAIASYEWLAAITLVVVAFAFLPYFLRAGIYTMPEFLEYRYNNAARSIMAIATVLIYMLLLGAVTYSGALTMQTLLGKAGIEISLLAPSLVIAFIAMVYVVSGGLKASVWADLLQGTALIIGGAIVMFFAFQMLGDADVVATFTDTKSGAVEMVNLEEGKGAMERFVDVNSSRLNMFLPASDNILPWTALMLGLWIPNFYYWGLNQYITQRTLGSATLAQGQKGIVFSAFLKLIIPMVVVIPGILAFNLFYGDMRLEARGDAGKAMVLYYKANPETGFVEVQKNPSMDEVKSWPDEPGSRYLVAVYDMAEKQKEIKAELDNPYVLSMTREDYKELKAPTYMVFDSKEDRAWTHVNPGLAEEVEKYNKMVRERATAEGGMVTKQALTAYKYDTAMAQLLGEVLPEKVGLVGFVLAALLGAVISSLAAMLNAASSIFTMDLYKKYISPNARQHTIVLLGRIAVVSFAVIAAVLSPMLGNPNISNSIFTIIQGSQGLISPGILAIFVFGFIVRRGPRMCGVAGLLTSIISYGTMWYLAEETRVFAGLGFMNNFLNRMAITFVLCLIVMTVMTILSPLKKPFVFEIRSDLELKFSKGALVAGLLCVLLTIVLYVIFSPLVLAS